MERARGRRVALMLIIIACTLAIAARLLLEYYLTQGLQSRHASDGAAGLRLMQIALPTVAAIVAYSVWKKGQHERQIATIVGVVGTLRLGLFLIAVLGGAAGPLGPVDALNQLASATAVAAWVVSWRSHD